MAYDLLLKNGTVVDGTGAPRFRADVAVAGDRIAEIGKISEGANRVIDASDLMSPPVSSIRTPITTHRFAGIPLSAALPGTASLRS